MLLELPRTLISDVRGGDASTNAELFRLLFDDRASARASPPRLPECIGSFGCGSKSRLARGWPSYNFDPISSGAAMAKVLAYRDAAEAYATG